MMQGEFIALDMGVMVEVINTVRIKKGTTAFGNRCSVGAQGRNEQMYSQRPDLTAMVKPLLAGTSKNVPAP